MLVNLNHQSPVSARSRSIRLCANAALFLALLAAMSVTPAGAQVATANSSNATSVEKVTNSTPPTTVAVASAQPDERYRIGPGDVLDIRIFNRPNLSREAVRVEGNGMIRMPLIENEIMAACKTEGELAAEIAHGYVKYYKNPQVDVFIKEYHSKQVAVIGAVNEQSRFELQRRIRLLELLTFAKGPSSKAGQTITVIHAPPALSCENTPATGEDPNAGFVNYKLSETLQGEPQANPYVEPGDTIYLPEAAQVYVVGNVYTPLTIPMREPITITRAVAMAGGVKQDTKKDKVRIVRQEPGSTTKKEIFVDLTAIEKKRAEDVALLPNDIVDVPLSGGKSFMRSLIQTVVPSIGSLPVRAIP